MPQRGTGVAAHSGGGRPSDPQDRVRRSMLLDFYGELLPPRQRECCELHYNEDLSLSEIAETCAALAPCVDASFIIDSLEFLHKGGRCSALAAFGANMLSLKPCIVVKDGKMGVGKKYRGKFGAVLPKYVSDRLGDGSDVIGGHIFVTHAGCEPAIIDACVEAVAAIAPEAKIHITRAGCTISSHCGRNTLGVLFIRTHAIGE